MLSRWGTGRSLALISLSLAVYAGCEPAKTTVPITKIDASATAAKAMSLYDSNKDGKISGPELNKAPGLKDAMDIMGTDGAKGITADMIAARIKKWADDKTGLVPPVQCLVTHNGAPLANADVKFVPETFISDYLKQVPVGKTDSKGWAQVCIAQEPESDIPPGLSPGFYRVEITKAGENIPAKYNTATTLGQEISKDGLLKRVLASKKMQFDLNY